MLGVSGLREAPGGEWPEQAGGEAGALALGRAYLRKTAARPEARKHSELAQFMHGSSGPSSARLRRREGRRWGKNSGGTGHDLSSELEAEDKLTWVPRAAQGLSRGQTRHPSSRATGGVPRADPLFLPSGRGYGRVGTRGEGRSRAEGGQTDISSTLGARTGGKMITLPRGGTVNKRRGFEQLKGHRIRGQEESWELGFADPCLNSGMQLEHLLGLRKSHFHPRTS